MQSEKELFNLIKETYPQNPSHDFIASTEKILRQKARSMDKKSKAKKLTAISGGIILFALAFSWLFFFSGKEAVTKVASSFGAESLPAAVHENEPLVFIYHSHNIESYMPELDGNKVFSETKNVTLVGEEFSKALAEYNINAIHDETDISGILEERNLSFADAYTVSREVLQQTLNEHKNVKMVFDIHRDSSNRAKSTINIDGFDYAKILFEVSKTTDNYEANKAFALEIHQKLEEHYPGLSKGVIDKGVNPKNNYNQDLKDNSVVVNIGGIENTFEEAYRSADALAEIIEDMIEEH